MTNACTFPPLSHRHWIISLNTAVFGERCIFLIVSIPVDGFDWCSCHPIIFGITSHILPHCAGWWSFFKNCCYVLTPVCLRLNQAGLPEMTCLVMRTSLNTFRSLCLCTVCSFLEAPSLQACGCNRPTGSAWTCDVIVALGHVCIHTACVLYLNATQLSTCQCLPFTNTKGGVLRG